MTEGMTRNALSASAASTGGHTAGSSPRSRRSLAGSITHSLTGSLRHSVRIALDQASIPNQDSVRSIGGRLGGHFDGTRGSLAGSLTRGVGSMGSMGSIPSIASPMVRKKVEVITEKTPLSVGTGGGKDVEEEEEHPPHSPPLTVWIVPALSCALAYALYNIFIKKGSASIHPILGGVILQFVAALLGTILLLTLMYLPTTPGSEPFTLHYDSHGLFWAIMAGLAVGTAEMLSFLVSGLGVPATQSIPIIIGGSVMFGAVKGLVLLGEQLMGQGWGGVGLLVVGIVFVALDPGEKVEEGGGGSGGGEVLGGPPAYWVAIALVCASMYAFYNIFIKKGSASINPILGGVVLQFVAAALGTLLLLAIILQQGSTSFLHFDRAGLINSCLAGIAVGTAEMLSFCVSGMGVNATQSIPIIIGGSVLFGAVLGLIMLGESMEWVGWMGVGLLTCGIGLVATDPGEKMEGH